ncbi:DUF2470 domain-containing protein [Cyanobacteria bacterium FACHB-DQ100]|uniref:DUF2470 domain-containing protein n=1 Tax=unclassified Leptolyngbya TaxID=2650499 RepID=UPI001680A01F|nr:DUF2470 domain-containing protein [Leptolyngbya sp. FACHB-17]MBD1823282.1 DUF2470 domain-containing protein [Cyanobacteria bacterium FACHB-DQ100]MBD2083172.1 DUF2470 domain-containing protein [Leptolyngbya sp. FACHB-17]
MSESVSEAFSPAVSDRICSHMNKDHGDAVLVYAQYFGKVKDATTAEMKSIDEKGMDLLAQVNEETVPVRVTFDRTLKDAKEAHIILVEMLKRVRPSD